MNFSRTESDFRFSVPEELPFPTWLKQDAHFFRVARPETRQVRRVIHLLDHPSLFEDVNPNYSLSHEDRLALTLRYISDRYQSPQYIFDLFGVNHKTMRSYLMSANEPRGTAYYTRLQAELTRRQEVAEQYLGERKRRKAAVAEPVEVRELAPVGVMPQF